MTIFLILILLSTSGNNVLYRRIIQPKLTEHEKDIDDLINQTKKSSIVAISQYRDMGIKYASELFLNTAVLGTKLLRHSKSTDIESRRKSLIEGRDIDPHVHLARQRPTRSYYEHDYESDAYEEDEDRAGFQYYGDWEVPDSRKSIRRPPGGSLRRLAEGKFKVRRGYRSINFFKRSFYPALSSIKSRDHRTSERYEKCSNYGISKDNKDQSDCDLTQNSNN
ncbi:hypothetical protein ACOME3_004503 [Neoechinorhynchus agilis]